jgi:hypothetical protein
MLVSTTKLVLLAHTLLVTNPEVFIKGTFDANSRAYQHAMRNLASLGTSQEITLKALKAKANSLVYFNFRNNAEVFAEAVWEARKQLISESKQTTDEESGETVDASTDTSTSSDVVEAEDTKKSNTKAK